jgi:hypothetical protein
MTQRNGGFLFRRRQLRIQVMNCLSQTIIVMFTQQKTESTAEIFTHFQAKTELWFLLFSDIAFEKKNGLRKKKLRNDL